MSDPSSSPSPVSKEVLLIIGPVLVGSFISYMLLGIVIVQVYLYYMSFPNDKLWIKLTVYSLFILDLMHTVALSSSSWSFLCSGWGRPEHLEFTEWGFALIPLFSGACSTIVQMFFVWRIYTLGNLATYSNKLLWTVIVLIISLSLAQFAGSVVATVQWFLISDLARFSEVFGEVAVWLGGGAAADVMITISMFYLQGLTVLLILSGTGAQLFPGQGHGQFTYDINWPPGPGVTLQPQTPSPELHSLLSQISPTRIQQTIETLVSFGTRHTLSSQIDPHRGIGAARDWLFKELSSYANASDSTKLDNGNPRMTVEIQSYVQGPAERIPNDTVISNVIATLKGTEPSSRTYVVSGHYDSRVTDVMNFEDDAPGADDDGSGVAISLELARIFAKMDPPPKGTIVFAAVAGEEQGLFGSTHLAQVLKNASVDVQGMLDNDIVGSSKGDRPELVDPWNIRMFVQGVPPTELVDGNTTQVAARVDIGAENDSPARELGRFGVEVASNGVTNMSVQMVYRPDRFLRGGDHLPFLDAGYPAVRFTEPNENFAHQHQDVRVDGSGMQFGDLIEFCDFDFISRVGKVNGAILYSLAMAPSMPKNVRIKTSVLTNNSTLVWDLPTGEEDDEVERYEIVWRPTEMPFWTKMIDVGKVGNATVLLSKDNVQFGVRAVGNNGNKSPAVAPVPAN
ncbi:hypothetical protein D9758_004404 [Tetrapyrgos nigripes]|uniref:Peptide hydrolase n=1 Tax=Tetrapyrgos nigripes TaxID=182062 RepID=A0A8H5GN96_9AGAR|nr:hypothetical protein D9758_004404 [Tetrapyrgos nigripes]